MKVRRDGLSELSAGAATDATVGKRFAGGKTTQALLVNTSGDTTVHTPATGKVLTVYWVGLSSSENNAAEVLATVRIGSGSATNYQWYLGNPGAFSHWEPISSGVANDALIVNLSNSGNPVLVNYTYSEA